MKHTKNCSCSAVGATLLLLALVAMLAYGHEDPPPPSSFTDARLANTGSSMNVGRVEVLTPFGWYSVCSYTWGSSETRVMCRQLGYSDTPGYSQTTAGNDGSTKVYYSINCVGNEEVLSDCNHNFNTLTTCNDVLLTCSPCQTNSVRLRGGLIPEQGNVELCINGGWTGVCGYRWDYKDAFVVCRQLGLPATDVVRYTSSNFNTQYHFTTSTFYYNCFGNETQLVYCLNAQYSCSRSNIAGVYCRGEIVPLVRECRENDIRLAGGRDHTEGRVEICSNGLWGTVYDGGHWDYYDAAVACRQLFGSSGHLRVNFFRRSENQRLFGHGTGPIVLSRLNCNGNERDLFQCSHSSYTVGAEHINSDVGVRCQQTLTVNTDNCINGAVRLVNGSAPYEGRVEMCYNRVWGSVCQSGWDNNDASVVCRQLGFQGANASALLNSFFGEGSGPYNLNGVGCSGAEGNLIDCSHDVIGFHRCQPGNDASVRCDDTQCNHGDVRLFGGYSDRDGVAEVCINGYWGDICDDDWDRDDATVFCRQLFGENTFTTSSCCARQRTTGNVTLANLNCATGNPNTIIDCAYDLVQGSRSFGCSLNEESLAGCYDQSTCTTGDVRLVNGSTSSEGRVEMCHSNVWGTIPTNYWHLSEAESTCQQLGLPWDWAIPVTLSLFGRGKARFISFTGCRTTEQSLTNCSWSSGTQFLPNSQYRNVINSAGVICQGILDSSSTVCEENDTRLVNGTNEMEGRVEICVYGSWVTMCDDGWGIEETQTVCKHLVYPAEGSFYIPSSPFGVDYSLPIAGHLSCTSETTNVGECQLTNRTTACHYGRSIGVVCKEREYYNVSIEAPQGPFEIGSVIQLNCSVTPQPDTRAPLTYLWRSPFTSTSVQNLTTTIYNYYPTGTTYYCHVYRSGVLIGIGRKRILVKGLLHPIVPTSIMAQYSETVTLQVNTTEIEVRHYLRELAWYHNGQRLIPNEHMLLSEENKTLTILNTTDEDSGMYEAMFEGLLVYPCNQYCERVHVNLLRYHPILSPVVFIVNSIGSIPQNQDTHGISINGVSALSSVIPFTDGDNITLTAKGYISKTLEAEQTILFWFRSGQSFSSSLSAVERLLLSNSNYLNVSQSFSLTRGEFSDAGVYEVQLVVDIRNSFFHHTQCRPYYNSFVRTSNRFGRQYIILSQAEVHLPYVDMLSFSLDVDKPSISQEESATITCSASIKYPPLTSISLLKDEVQLAMTSDEMLQLNTRDIGTNAFGVYVCVMEASGAELQKEFLLKEKGNLQLEIEVAKCSKNMTDLVAQSLASKIQDECSCNFTVEALKNTSVTCSGNKMNFETTVEFSTNDGHETASSVINRIVDQASYAAFSLDVNGSTLMVTSACSECSSSFSAGAGAVAGSFIGGLLTGIIILCVIAAIVILVMKKRQSSKSFPVASPPPFSTNPPAKPSTASHTTATEDRYASQAAARAPTKSKAPKQPMVSTKPNRAYIKQAPKEREVEQELYEDVDMSADGGGEAIYEETM